VVAVRKGKFHIWPVRTADEGIELLTGVSAGEKRADGSYPANTVHGRADAKIREFAERLREYATALPQEEEEEEEGRRLAAKRR